MISYLQVDNPPKIAGRHTEKPSFPPKPQRQELRKPENIREYAAVIVYYEFLVEEWEQWAETVEYIAGVDDGEKQ